MTHNTVGELVRDVASGAKSILDGLRVTFYSLVFRKRVTDQYPHKNPEQDYRPGPGYRGMLGLVTDPETGELHCTACGQCQKICPDDCIRVEGEGKGKERKPVRFTIDMSKCMYCGLCTEACPFDAITMTPKYTGAVEHVEELIWDLERLRKEAEGLPHISRVEETTA
jgi:NADH-quinone oxidoreductase subunit I